MPKTIPTLKEYYDRASADLEPHQAQTILSNIEELLRGAILDPSEEIRDGLIGTLKDIFSNTVRAGFAADRQLCLVFEYEGQRKIFSVCDMPKTYCESPSKPKRFDV